MQQASRSPEARQEQRPPQWAMRLILALCVTAFTLVPAGARAQIAGTANIQGTVTDPTGAVVAKAALRSLMKRLRSSAPPSPATAAFIFSLRPGRHLRPERHGHRLQNLCPKGHCARSRQQHRRQSSH